MVNEEIVGTDIDRNWILNAGTDEVDGVESKEGDISLVRGSDNLSQAIYLRLTALIDEYERCSLDWAYDLYGSKTKQWLGKNQNVYTRSTLVSEIKRRVTLDPRIDECDVQLINWTSTSIGIKITARIVDGTSFQDYYIFSDIPRYNDNVNSPIYSNTYIKTRDEGYYGKQGEILSVYCFVMDSEDKRVPIGEVELSIGEYVVKEKDMQNPMEVGQSGSREPGGCVFKFHIPQFMKKGTHKLRFKYKGVRGYNNCIGETNLYIIDRIPTSMEFKYPVKNRHWYYANDYDYFTDPVVHVTDANDWDVEHGEVRYYLSDYGDDEEIIFLEFPIIFHGSRLLQKRCYMRVKSVLLEYSSKFIFRVDYMFKQLDVFELVSATGETIDWLECIYDAENQIYWLTSTTVARPYEDVEEYTVTNSAGKTITKKRRLNTDRNDDIDLLRKGNNCGITMEVIE